MNFIFKGTIIDYEFIDSNSKSTIIFLHGWGGNKNSFLSTINLLKHKFNILTLTMPTVEDTIISYQLNDYKNIILYLINLHNLKNINIVCHSFGFRVATLLKEEIEIKKLVVTGGAGAKKISVLKRINLQNNIILLKQKNFNFLYDKIASSDYKNLSYNNKITFKNVVNLNTINMLKFNCSILIFWGKKDKETMPWIAKKILKLNTAKLYLLNSGHFAYLDYNSKFNHLVVNFFS